MSTTAALSSDETASAFQFAKIVGSVFGAPSSRRAASDARCAYAGFASWLPWNARVSRSSSVACIQRRIPSAVAVSSLLKAAVVLKEPRHAEQALATLDFLLEELWDENRGMYHYWDGTYHLPGLLSDQAYVLRALIDAAQYAGENRYLSVAKRLADLSIENLHSPGGGFFDTLHDPLARGGLRRRNRSILENSVIAEALLRLARFLHEDDYADTARETLASFAHDYKRYGHFVAGYARAVDLFFHEPVQVTIVGPRRGDATRALAEAALRPYVASRIVRILDPSEDAALLERSGLRPAGNGAGGNGSGAHAYVHRGRGSYAETSDPVRLPALMSRVERGS